MPEFLEPTTKALACGSFTAMYWTSGFSKPGILTTKVAVIFVTTYTLSSSFFNICLSTVGYDKLNDKNIYLCVDIASALISTYVALKFTTISCVFKELLISAALSTLLTKVASIFIFFQRDNCYTQERGDCYAKDPNFVSFAEAPSPNYYDEYP